MYDNPHNRTRNRSASCQFSLATIKQIVAQTNVIIHKRVQLIAAVTKYLTREMSRAMANGIRNRGEGQNYGK